VRVFRINRFSHGGAAKGFLLVSCADENLALRIARRHDAGRHEQYFYEPEPEFDTARLGVIFDDPPAA